MTLCFMCRKPIPPESDDERHYQNRQVVEYAGEPIHRDCHPQQMPAPDTDHVAVHEHLLQAQRELAAALDECTNLDSELEPVEDIMELQVRVKAAADEYQEEHL